MKTGDKIKDRGFTIVELLTVMSIIVLLISLLVPALGKVRRYALEVKQRAQFHTISVALEQFNSEFDGYPDSNARDDQGNPYNGAMKLAEAMVGQDLKGFHPKSRFRREAFAIPNVAGTTLYPSAVDWPNATAYMENLKSRKLHLQLENANAYKLGDVYNSARLADTSYGGVAYDTYVFVLCDVYNRVTNISTGQKIGMPILYYRADTTRMTCPGPNDAPDYIQNHFGSYIYEVRDNQGLIDKGLPWDLSANGEHPLASWLNYPKPFYDMIRDPMVPTLDRPYRADSYILLSAGFDGRYGTDDDIFNFKKDGK